MSRSASTALAATLYLAVALACYAPVLGDPFGALPVNAPLAAPVASLVRWDQSIAVASIARNAHALLREPWSFFDGFQCFPLPRSYTLGEHMFGCGVLAAPVYLVSGDPVFSYNVLLIASAWIAALGMFFLARELVANVPAAFVAGLLFGFSTMRIAGVAHPFAYADLWTPPAILFLLRLFARGGWRNALGLSLFASLEILQSFYPLFWTTVLMACLSIHLAVVHRRRLPARLPEFAACLLALALVAWLVFGPYLETQSTWGLLDDRVSLPLDPRQYLTLSPLLLLGLLGLADRVRGARPCDGVDPRIPLAVGGVLLFWIAIGRVTVFGVVLSLRGTLAAVIPGFDAVRGLYTVVGGTDLALAVLAAYGVRAVTERLPRAARVAAVSALAVWIVVAQHVPLAAWAAAPPADDVALLRRTQGPIAALPFPAKDSLIALANADLLRFTSYDTRRSSVCYASFASPLDEQMRTLMGRFPDRGAADALRALGFRTVMLLRGRYFPRQLEQLERKLDAGQAAGAHMRLVGRNERVAFYDLHPGAAPASDLAALVPDPAATRDVLEVAPGASARIPIAVANGGARVFRHPAPIAPSDVIVRWTNDGGETVASRPGRVLLPLALAPGTSMPVVLEDAAPATSGEYAVTIELASRPGQVVGRRTVRVATPTA